MAFGMTVLETAAGQLDKAVLTRIYMQSDNRHPQFQSDDCHSMMLLYQETRRSGADKHAANLRRRYQDPYDISRFAAQCRVQTCVCHLYLRGGVRIRRITNRKFVDAPIWGDYRTIRYCSDASHR
jgi:hypothetical protein